MIIKEYFEHPYATKFENLGKTYSIGKTKCQMKGNRMKGNRKLK